MGLNLIFMKYLLFGLALLFSVDFFAQEIELSNKEYEGLQDKLRIKTATNIDSAFLVAERIGYSNNTIHKAFSKGAKSYLYQIKGYSFD